MLLHPTSYTRDPNSVLPRPPVPGQPARREQQQLKGAAQEFEAILIATLLKEAQSGAQVGSLGGGLPHDLYQQLFIDEVAKAIARSGGLGLGKMLEQQLQRMFGAGIIENRLKERLHPADVTNRRSIQVGTER